MSTIQKGEQGTIFKNPYLEIFTKTGPIITIITYGTFAGLAIAFSLKQGYTTSIESIYLFVAGLFVWTFTEYLMHRYLFHWASESKIAKRITYIFHGIHHDYPKDKERNFMPPLPGFLFSVLFISIFYLILGKMAFVFFAGFIIGYMVYALIHFSTHQVKSPPKFLQPLFRHHLLHHYKYPDKAYGVSTPIWDMVFGTMPPKKVSSTKK